VNPSAGSITTSRQYLERKDAGKVLQAFPAADTALPTEVTPNFDPDEVHVRVEDSTGAHKPYRYMFDTVQAKDSAVQSHVTKLTDAIVSKHSLGELIDRTRSINVPHQESSVYVGELTSEGEGLNEKTIQLASGHIRVRLDLADLPSYSLFCGQAVAVKGLNGMGTRIVVESLHHDAALPHFVPPKLGEGADEDEPDEAELRSQQLRVMVAAGPFSTRDDLRYYPLNDLLDKVHQRRPHALILVRYKSFPRHFNSNFLIANSPLLLDGSLH
jgi:DNA polymerase alpha subunit B